MRQHRTGNNISNVVPEAPDNIVLEKIQAMLSFTSKKKKNLSFLYYGNQLTMYLTKAERAAQHFTQQPVKLLVGCYLNK